MNHNTYLCEQLVKERQREIERSVRNQALVAEARRSQVRPSLLGSLFHRLSLGRVRSARASVEIRPARPAYE